MNSVERVKLFCKERKIPISRLEKDLGYANGYIGQLKKGVLPDDRLVEIARYLNVTAEYLLMGEQKEKTPAPFSKRDERDIEKRLEAMIGDLDAPAGGPTDGLMFSGEPLDDETRELLRASLRSQLEMTKRLAKQKFTPKKYRKEGE